VRSGVVISGRLAVSSTNESFMDSLVSVCEKGASIHAACKVTETFS